MTKFTARARIVATHLVTVLTAVVVVLTTAAPTIADQVPDGWADDVTLWTTRIGAWLLGAVSVIRSTMRLPRGEAGIKLPPT